MLSKSFIGDVLHAKDKRGVQCTNKDKIMVILFLPLFRTKQLDVDISFPLFTFFCKSKDSILV